MIQSPDSIPTPSVSTVSRYLKKEVVRCYNAISFANQAYGLPMNTHITLALGTIGIRNHDCIAAIVSDFNHRVGKWLSGRDCQHVYVYSHEGYSKRGFGMHTHILTHIPKSAIAEFRLWAVECVSLLTELPVQENTICIKHRTFRREDHQVWLQWRWFSYLFKGCDPNAWVMNHRTGQPERLCDLLKLRGWSMGEVRCRRRAGMSENIATKAQEGAGFWSALDNCDNGNLFSGWEFHAYRQEQRDQDEAAKAAEVEATLRFSLMGL